VNATDKEHSFMFEAAELGHEVDKDTYNEQEPRLREALLLAQIELKEKAPCQVIVVMAGLDGAGKSETVHQLNEWMDPRLIETRAFDAPTDEERERSPMWRYWRVLPPKGKIGILYGAWYEDPIELRFRREIDDAELDERALSAARLERMLVNEGALVLKFWFHLSKADQRERLKKLSKNELTAWRVTDDEREHLDGYKRYTRGAERMLRQTDIGEAPWIVVEGKDERYRNLTVGRALLDALRARLDSAAPRYEAESPPLRTPVDGLEVLDKLDLTLSLSKEDYERELLEWQGRLNLAMRASRFRKHHSLVAVFEGNDAAGKGGAIRRVIGALDARHYETVAIAAPTEEERAQPYLWRFWRRLPRRGELTIFDRSWYGRVLVERVEGLTPERDWMRAYSEIDEFEAQQIEHGVVLVKFWLAIDQEEQMRRFQERESTPWKRFKITPDDYRNRDKWDAYAAAVNDMVERTSTEIAPWTLVEANDKRYARVKVLRTLATAVESVL
jgi:AMP-polyphosphate phosphotransferase